MTIPLLILTLSSFMKITGNQDMVRQLSSIGFGPYITYLGIIEIASVILFIMPKTYKLGFLLLCGYLGGAMSVELSHGRPPIATILLTMIWISVFVRNKEMFLLNS